MLSVLTSSMTLMPRVKSAEASVKRLTRPGVTVEPYTIDLDDFLGWCTVQGCEFDAKGRDPQI